MGLTTKYSFLLQCVLLLLFYDNRLASGSSCRTGCSGSSNSLLKLDEGTTYVYNLEGLTETSLPKSKGPNGESVKLNLKAKVEVTALPQCATLIKLKGVQVTGPDNKKHASLDKLEANPLLVSLNGGRLNSEVCAAADDDYTSLNIKRAVASLFQVNINEDGGSGTEVDVFGSCPTDFHIQKEGDVVTVHKRRNLNYCAYREGLHQLWFAVPHGHSSDSQTTPLLEPEFESEQKIQNKILESAVVKETYLFKPFSNRDNGAKTKVVTKLTLESKSSGGAPAQKNSQPRSIIFENPHEQVTATLTDVQKALLKVVDSVGEAVPVSAAHDFENLVELTRHASKDDLISIYGNAKSGAGFKNKDLAKKVFIDALFQARSADSVAVAIELLKNHEIEGVLAQAWYLSFAFVSHTTASSLASAASLLEEPKLPHAAYLGVGALAGQYCREHVCDSVPELNTLLSKLAKNIENPTKEKEHLVLASLKGLKNARHLNDDASKKVIQIVKDSKVSTRVRATALEAAKADACRQNLQKAAGEVLGNREEDSELRIKAYLVLVECPNSKIATKLNELLETETVNQVGAFITSHLRNLRASVNPDREGAREILYNVRSKKKFPIDIRKFSQNHELSHRFDALSTSASLESNVIYSQKSYIPRSANLNLTTEVFGQAFNLFEISGRAENIDKCVERIFGPKGYLRTHKPEEIIKEGQEGFTKWRDILSDKLRNTVRGKRSVTRQQTDAFASKVKLHNNELDKNLDVDLSLSLLGNELVWLHLDDSEEINPAKLLDKLSNIVNKELGKVKDFNHDLKNHYHFLDTHLSYPTATGLPLKLSAHGSAVAHVKLGGSLDLGTILKDPKNGEAKFKIIPSASVEVTGALSIDAYAVEAGLKVVGNLHTATGTDISLKLLDGHGFDLNIGLPVKNSDILTVTSEALTTVRERGHSPVDQKLEFNLPRKDFHGCFDQLQTLVGLTVCSDVGFPYDQQPLVTNAALYPLNGHSKVSVRLDKEDDSLKSYNLKFYFNIDDPKNRRLEVKINTPGSKTPRELSLLASAVTEPNKAISVQFVSPIHTFSVEGAIVENDKEYSLSGSVNLDNNLVYKARLGVIINGNTYTPVLEYTPVGGAAAEVKVEGTVTVVKEGGKRKYTFNNVRIIANKVPYSVDGTIIRDVNSFATDLKLGYDKHTVGVKTKVQRQGERNLKINAEITPSQYQDFSFALKYEYQRDDTHVENSLIFVHGPDLTSKLHRLTVFTQTHYKGESPTALDVSTKNTLSYPLFEIEGKFEAAATKKSVSYDLELTYAKQKARSKLNAKTSVNKFGDYDIDFLAGAADHEITAEFKREILDTYKSKFTNIIELKPGGKYEANAEVTHQFKVNDVNARLSAQVRVPELPDDYKLDIGVITNPALFDGHTKIASGPNEFVHAVLKFARKAPLNGNFKLNVRNVVESSGEYKYGDGKGKGDVLVHVLPLKRKVKGSADLNVAGSKHTGVIEVSWDADKDNTKKLHIETDTDVTKSSINSKNKLKLLDKQLKVDFHGDLQGKPLNGKTAGGFEVTIPNGRIVSGKLRESLQIVPAASNFELFLELATAEKEGAHPTKIYLDTYAKNVDIKRYQADTKFEGGYECHSGKHVYSQTLKSTPQDGKLVIDHQNSLTGVIDKPINSKTNLVLGRPDSSYTTSIVVGEYSIDSTGKYHHEHNHREVEHKTEIKTPLDIAKNLLIKDKWHLHKGDETTPYQANINEEVVWNDKTFKLEGSAEIHPKKGFVKGSTSLPGTPSPISLDVSWKHETAANDVRKAEVNFKSSYDSKNLDWNVKSDYTKDLGLINTHVAGKTPYEPIKDVDLQINYKRISSVSRNTDLKLTLNGKKIDGYANIDLTQNHPVIDILLNHPEGKSRIYYKLDKKSERQADSEGQLIWTRNGGGQVDFNSKVDLESLDSFIINVFVNSEKLNINKLKLELGNRLTKGGAAKRINFSAQTSDKKGFSGSVSYAIKENDVGFVIDGKGNIEIQSEKHPLTYKAVFKRLSKGTDKETGTSFTLNADYGKGKLDVIHKVTDKEYHYKTKACLDGCALFEVKSKLEIIDYVEIKHDAVFTYENKLNGRNDALSVVSKTHRRGIWVDHETDLKVKDVKYGLNSYLHEQEAAILIELPTREIEAKATYELPLITKKQNVPNTFTARLDSTLALDKKKAPKEVANFLVVGELTTAQKTASASAEIKFSHPSLQKDLVIRAKAAAGLEKRLAEASVELDIFNKKNQKVTATAKVDHDRAKNGHKFTVSADFASKGLIVDLGSTAYAFSNKEEYSAGASAYYADDKGTKKEFGASVEGSPTRFLGIVKVPNKELARLETKVQATKDSQTLEVEVDVVQRKLTVLKVEVTGWKTIKAVLHTKANPKQRLEGKIDVSSKQLEVRAERVNEPARDSLFFVVVKLDDAKPVYELNSENLKKLVGDLKKETDDLAVQYQTLIKTLTEELLKQLKTLLESFKKAQPNLKPLLDQYKAQFEAIRKELEQDPEFKKLAEFVRKIVGGLIEALEEKTKKIVEVYEKLQAQAVEIQEKFIASYNKVLPEITKTFETLLQNATKIFQSLTELATVAISRILEIIRQNDADIKQVITSLSETFQDVSKVSLGTINKLRHEIEDFVKLLLDQVKALPIYTELKEKYGDLLNLELPEQFWHFYSEFTFAVEDFLPTAELKALAKSIFTYIEKRLKKQQVDDAAALRGISEDAVKAFRSILEQLKAQHLLDQEPAGLLKWDIGKLPLPLGLGRLPALKSLGDLSILRHLRALSDLPSVTDYYYTYRPTLNPLDYIPPYRANGYILGSHHFFTFDRKHIAFKGTCSYVLAQDFLDGNFSIIANLENGKLKSIVVNDKTDTVELLHDNTVLLNGKAQDFPVIQNDFVGWREYGSTSIKNKAGIWIKRYSRLDIIVVQVSGFYFGRTRGLLGTINNEQYDEFTLPNGHIAKDGAELANAYKVTDSCAAVPELKHTGAHAAECTKFFTSDSSLRSSFPYINPDIYREACDQHVAMSAADKLKAACEVVSAYLTALKRENVPFVSLPTECAKCTEGGKALEYGDRNTVTSPTGKADVIFVVEQSTHNSPVFKELVTPLITSLSQDLKEKGLTDTEFVVIGYGGPDQKWPAIYGNNGKLTYEGKADNIVFGEREKLTAPYDTTEKKIKLLWRYYKIETGKEQIVMAMNEANNYPFRQGAAKIIVLVNSSPCSKSPTFPVSLQLLRIFEIRKFYKDHGLNFNIISPLAGLTIANNADQKTKNIVGFDHEKIYTLGDAKKKPLDGDATDRPKLNYQSDLCLEFSQEYGGAAFSSQNFLDAKPDQKKKFVQVASQRIVQGATAYKYTEDCTCTLYKGVYPYQECKVSSKDHAR